MLSKQQIQIIHVAKSQLHLEDEHYRAILSAFGVTSSTQLTYEQFKELLTILEARGFKNTAQPANSSLVPEGMATFRQRAKIVAMWRNNPKVRDLSNSALNNFIARIAGVQSINWLPRHDVQKVIKAIKSLN